MSLFSSNSHSTCQCVFVFSDVLNKQTHFLFFRLQALDMCQCESDLDQIKQTVWFNRSRTDAAVKHKLSGVHGAISYIILHRLQHLPL